jgi:hypothetical protein
MALSEAEAALVSSIYDPPRTRHGWMLRDVLPPGPTRHYSLARWALVDALRVCGVGRGDRVLVPGLVCREVLASLHAIGAVAAFYRVSRQLTVGVAGDVGRSAKAALAVNYFGFPQRLDVFTEAGSAVIEDNAHGFLSCDEAGRLLGSRGDVGIFSFRKTIAVADGGALVVNGARQLPSGPEMVPIDRLDVRYRAKQALRRVGGRCGPVRARQAIERVRRLRRAITGSALPSSSLDAEERIPLPPNPSSSLGRPITVADPAAERDRRRRLYDLAGQLVAKVGGVPVFPDLPPHVVPSGFPVFAAGDQAEEIAGRLADDGLLLTRWPDLPVDIACDAPDHYRQLMVVPFLW